MSSSRNQQQDCQFHGPYKNENDISGTTNNNNNSKSTKTSTSTAAQSGVGRDHRSVEQQHKVVRNPYASNTTPLCRTPSLGNRPQASSSSLAHSSSDKSGIVANGTPPVKTHSLGDHSVSSGTLRSLASSPAKKSRSPSVKNPYRSSGKKSNNNPAIATAITNTVQSTSAFSSPASRSCGISYPKLREKTKQRPDLRPNLVLALWKFARSNLTRDSYKAKQLDQYVGRIVDLAITAHDFPVRTLGEYAFRKGAHIAKRGRGGVSTLDALKRLEDDLNSTGVMEKTYHATSLGGNQRYFSIAEACLVAMKEEIVRRWKNRREDQQQQPPTRFPADGKSQTALFSQKHYFVSLVDLIPEIDRRLRPECPSKLERKGETDHGVAFYLTQSTVSAEFKQIEKLLVPIDVELLDGTVQVTTYLKKRSVGGKQHYELTPKGFEKAVIISKRDLPAPIGHYRCSNLYRVLPKYDKICVAVDLREGGAAGKYRKVLHEMCNRLDMQKIPYFVNTLNIGDYCFFSGEKLCPILVERKSVQDVAMSIDIDDGRWTKQKHRMYQGQFVFGYDNCRMAYIIEGKVEKHLVSKGFIGNARHKVSKELFDQEVANLEKEGFDVLRTSNVENSMFQLARWAESVATDVRRGRLKPRFTYNEFVEEVKKIPSQTKFLESGQISRRATKGKRTRDSGFNQR